MEKPLTICLVINIMEDISPENIQQLRADHKAVHRHPQSVSEGCKGKRDDEIGEDRRDQDDKRFGGDEVEKEPHNPGEECLGCWLEVPKPVGNHREDYIDQDWWDG